MALKVIFNPLSGGFDYIDDAAENQGGGVQSAEFREITEGEVAAKQLTLSHLPDFAGAVRVTPVGGPMQQYGADYTVAANVLSWDGRGLEPFLEAGDTLIIEY